MTVEIYMETLDGSDEVKIEAEVSVTTSAEDVGHPDEHRTQEEISDVEVESLEVNGKPMGWRKVEAIVGDGVWARIDEAACEEYWNA